MLISLGVRAWLPSKQRGATLVELMVVVAIMGVLAAISIPVVTGYAKRSRLSEAVSNIQSILISEQAFFSRYSIFTANLAKCPNTNPGKTSENWPADPDAACGPGWNQLGWKPEGSVFFKYQVFTSHEPSCIPAPLPCPPCVPCPPGVPDNPICPPGQTCPLSQTTCPPNTNAALTSAPGISAINTFGVNWDELSTRDIFQNTIYQPWVAVQAVGDTDGDGALVYIRGNSFNQKTFRYAIAPNDPESTW
jgi:prepilin-type N-terminal cleavage/methylation domain-containing protein